MKTLNKFLIVIGILVLIIASYFVITNFIITGRVIVTYHTQAICDENNVCQDYEIYCDDGVLIKITPINGAIIQNVENWTDPRGIDGNKLC
ncbi:hypothetical protein KAS08_04890 [Candidatus Pacearchaeota archaeon]|nr:hypothetical protein [Candidatus Pacearchaeota archaeon]